MVARGEPVPLLGQFFRLTLGYNTGVAFGLFADGGPWPHIVTCFIIAGIVTWLTNALRAGELLRTPAWPVGWESHGSLAPAMRCWIPAAFSLCRQSSWFHFSVGSSPGRMLKA